VVVLSIFVHFSPVESYESFKPPRSSMPERCGAFKTNP
jgi:hypothetical protein